MDNVVASSGVTDIVFVPWAAEEHAGYLKTYPDTKEMFRSPRFEALLAETKLHELMAVACLDYTKIPQYTYVSPQEASIP